MSEHEQGAERQGAGRHDDDLVNLDSHLMHVRPNRSSLNRDHDFLPPPDPIPPDSNPGADPQSGDIDLASETPGDASESDRGLVEIPLASVKSVASVQNHEAARLGRDDVSSCRIKTGKHSDDIHLGSVTVTNPLDARGSVASQHRHLGATDSDGEVDLMTAGTQVVTAGDLWRSLLWLVTLVLMFLSVISFGPMLVEKYQYAAAKGRMKAQYEAATDMLSRVSFKDSTLASELVVHKISPSVVSVRATSHSSIAKYQVEGTGQGSGVILSTEGFIITNNHVVEGADQIEVTLADRREYVGKVVGRDRETDLAVLRIDATDLIAAEWGNSNDLELGSAVWAMGSPFGLDQTVTRGIISGKHRRTADTLGNPNPHQDLLQTDAAINPGNSGGPLVNSRGEVIGINTSIYGESFQGISFAVPSTLAKEIVGKLIEKGAVKRGFLGVRPIDVTHSDAMRLQLPRVAGVLVTLVEPNSPADNAGLRRNDVILELDGEPIENQTLLFRHIGMTEPGSTVEVKYVRNGVVQTATTEIVSSPNSRSY